MTQEERLMKEVVEAWGRADIGPIFAALDENVVWRSASAGRKGQFRFGGEYRGRQSVVALLSKISTAYFFSRYETKEVMSKGDVVWGLFVSHGTYSPMEEGKPGVPFVLEQAMRWRIRDGKIVEAQTFFDTAGLLAQQSAAAA